jgi:hypothetical protein
LGDLLGVHAEGKRHGPSRPGASDHSYLRLLPDASPDVNGPKSGAEPSSPGKRHPILYGFEETNILPFGGCLEEIRTDAGTIVPLTLIPSFPIYPPETSWMRTPRTDISALVLKEQKNGARIAYLAADIDRRFGLANLPDHGDLLANLVRWAGRDNIPLSVEGPGLIDCHLYRQPGQHILHLVNLTSAGTWRSPLHDLISVGPLRVKVRLPAKAKPTHLLFLVSGEKNKPTVQDGWTSFNIKSVLDHEVVVII